MDEGVAMDIVSWENGGLGIDEVGGKAASLADLVAAGFRVPQGFVVGAAAFRAAMVPHHEGLRQRLSEAGDDLELIERARQWLAGQLGSSGLPAEIMAALDDAYRTMGSPPVAVRSSATAEDLAEASFAGQYDTVLGVEGIDDVVEALKAVWLSLYSPRAVRYRHEHGFGDDAAMAVIIQELAPARVAGVMFTRNPVTGDDSIVISAARGFGDGVVSGTATTDTYAVDPATGELLERSLGAGDAVLEAADLDELVTLGKRVRETFSEDRDIEFAIADNGIWLLQARPITGLPARQPDGFPLRWDDPADEARSWRLRSTVPASALELDIQRATAIRMAAGYGETGSPMMANHLWCVQNGYLYLAAPDSDPEELSARQSQLARLAESFASSGTSLYQEEIEPVLLERLAELRRLREDTTLLGRFFYLEAAIAAYADAMGNLHWRMRTPEIDWDATYSEITGRPADEAGVMLQAIVTRTTDMITSIRALARVVQSDRALSDIFETRQWERLDETVLPATEATRRFSRMFGHLLAEHGLRTGMGLGSVANFRSPTWEMDPSVPLGIIASYSRQDLDELDARDEALRLEREALESEIVEELAADPSRAARFELARVRMVNAARCTEDHNHLMEQACGGSMRDAIWRMGGHLVREGLIVDADDMFDLSMEELGEIARGRGPEDLSSLVVRRRRQAADWARLEPPRHLGPRQGTDPRAALFAPPEGAGIDGEVLRGLAASRGVCTGPARVVEASLAPPDIRRGEILVASIVGDAWAPVFPLLGGLVLDFGGVSQHAAVVAREYGIPAVMMTREATKVISDGQIITVDGDGGLVLLTG